MNADIATIRATSKKVHSSYGDPRMRGAGSLYQKYPERSEWTEFEVYEGADGHLLRVERSVYRWGGQFSYGPWTLVA